MRESARPVRILPALLRPLAGALLGLIVVLAAGAPASASSQTQGTVICGTITQDTWWTLGGSPYLITCYSEVAPGARLVIMPGVVVRSAGVRFGVHGSLLAGGTADQPITFTSSAPTPAPGDWLGLWFAGDQVGSRLEHVILEYAGAPASGGIELSGGPLWIFDTEIRRNSGGGINALDGYLEVTGSTIHDNRGDGIRYCACNQPARPKIVDNAFVGNDGFAFALVSSGSAYLTPIVMGNTGGGNGINGIHFDGVLNGATLYANPGLPYVVEPLQTSPGSTLTITAGAVFKGDDVLSGGKSKIIIKGSLQVLGNEVDRVVFTSLKDDTVGGDTNGDGSLSQPLPGDWRGILFQPQEVTPPPLPPPAPAPPPIPPPVDLDHVVYMPLLLRAVPGERVGDVPASLPAQTALAPLVEAAGGERIQEIPAVLSASHLDYAIIRYSGSDTASLELLGGEAEITNSTIGYGAGHGIYAEDMHLHLVACELSGNAEAGLQYFGDSVPIAPVLIDNAFNGNGTYAAYLIFNGGCDPETEMHGNTGTGNGLANGIYVEGQVSDPQGCRWQPNPSFPYVVWAITIAPGGVLRLDPGVVMKFAAPYVPPQRGTGVLLIDGTFEALGSAAQRVVFTSFWDDSIGGDTNADGDATQPAPGDWKGIDVNETGQAALNYSSILYAGSDDIAVYNNGGLLAISHSTVAWSPATGISNLSGGTLSVFHSAIHDNGGKGISSGATISGISQTDFYHNGLYGVESWANGLVPGEGNYWGSPQGPTCDAPQPPRDRVNCTKVDYQPYATTPFH